MAYKHTFNRDYNYLVHFNKNHDPKNGRFTFGDGDGIPNNKNRKYQNDDGSLTEEGQKKFGKLIELKKAREDQDKKAVAAVGTSKEAEEYEKSREMGKKYVEEFMQVAYSRYDFFTKVGVDRVEEILKNYDQHQSSKQEKEKLLKDNGWKEETTPYGSFFIKKVKGAEIFIDSADEIKYGNAVAKSIEKNKSRLDKEKDRILKEEMSDWGDNNLSNKTKGFKLQSVTVFGDSDTAEANYWWDGPNDPIGGHEISIEFDIKTGKPITYSVNG